MGDGGRRLRASVGEMPREKKPSGPSFVGPQPYPGIPVRRLKQKPQPGQVLVRYEIVRANPGCLEYDTLSTTGWVSTVIAALCLWPLICVPCCLRESHETYQVAIWGDPSDLPPGYTVDALPKRA